MEAITSKRVAPSSITNSNERQQKLIVELMRASASVCEVQFSEWKQTWEVLEGMVGKEPNFINDLDRTTMIADDKLGNISSAVIKAMSTFRDGMQLLEEAGNVVPKHSRKRSRSRSSIRGE